MNMNMTILTRWNLHILGSSEEFGLFDGLDFFLLSLDNLFPLLEELLIPLRVDLIHDPDTKTVGRVNQLSAHFLEVYRLEGRVLTLNKSDLIQMFSKTFEI